MSASARPKARRRRALIVGVLALVLTVGGVGSVLALTSAPPPVAAPAAAPPVATIPTSAASRPSRPPSAAPGPKPPATDPLTGRKPSDHPVVAVKIENIAAARPQAGVAAADIVFVEEVEGRLTRLVAVYHSRFPGRVGPVRSARNTDVELLPMFGRPGLVYSGANARVQRNIDRASIVALPRSTRDPRRSAPHNVFVDLDAVAARTKLRSARSIGWTFATSDRRWAAAPKAGRATGRVGGDTLRFDYTGGRYLVRWNGRPYADRARTDNVVVLGVRTRPDGNADVNGARSVKSETVGSGQVTVYRDGRRLSGTWRRSGVAEPMVLRDGQGKPLPLKPGRTWVLLD